MTKQFDKTLKCPNTQPDLYSLWSILEKLNISPNKIYDTTENICRIGLTIKDIDQSPFLVLPFCTTVEAKAMGANIKPCDATAGPRMQNPIFCSLDEIEVCLIEQSPWGATLLSACQTLTQEDLKIFYYLTGPISILNSLIDLKYIFLSWRKQPEQMIILFDSLQNILLRYMNCLFQAGVSQISFADPIGNPEIFGLKYSQLLAEEFTVPFLKQAVTIAQRYNGKITICPKMGVGLERMNLIERAAEKQGDFGFHCEKIGIGSSETATYVLIG